MTLFLKGLDRRYGCPDLDVDVVDFVDNLGVMDSIGVDGATPALLTMTSKPLSVLRACSDGGNRSRSETSTFTAMARPPALLIQATALAVASL